MHANKISETRLKALALEHLVTTVVRGIREGALQPVAADVGRERRGTWGGPGGGLRGREGGEGFIPESQQNKEPRQQEQQKRVAQESRGEEAAEATGLSASPAARGERRRNHGNDGLNGHTMDNREALHCLQVSAEDLPASLQILWPTVRRLAMDRTHVGCQGPGPALFDMLGYKGRRLERPKQRHVGALGPARRLGQGLVGAHGAQTAPAKPCEATERGQQQQQGCCPAGGPGGQAGEKASSKQERARAKGGRGGEAEERATPKGE